MVHFDIQRIESCCWWEFSLWRICSLLAVHCSPGAHYCMSTSATFTQLFNSSYELQEISTGWPQKSKRAYILLSLCLCYTQVYQKLALWTYFSTVCWENSICLLFWPPCITHWKHFWFCLNVVKYNSRFCCCAHNEVFLWHAYSNVQLTAWMHAGWTQAAGNVLKTSC